MQLPLSHSLSLLSVGAKSHISTASGCVDSFTNRNVKRHTLGGLRDKGGSRTGQETEQTWPRDAQSATLKHLDAIVLITEAPALAALIGRIERKCCCWAPLGFPTVWHTACAK